MSDTPLTDKEVLKSIEAVVRFGIEGGEVAVEQQLVTANFARKLERERDALKELSLQLAKELVSKCSDPVHKHQVSELQDFDKYWKSRPTTMCTSDSANCQLPTAYEL
jgi:hypothetical protein